MTADLAPTALQCALALRQPPQGSSIMRIVAVSIVQRRTVSPFMLIAFLCP